MSMAGGDDCGEGSARRRRQRRLHSWLKHERQSVAMALAENTHHASRTRQGPEPGRGRARDALRPKGTEDPASGGAAGPPAGARVAAERPLPAALRRGDLSWWCRRCVATMASTAARSASLLKKNLALQKEERRRRGEKVEAQQKEEEHEERMLALNRRVRDDLPLTLAEHAAWKEWACRPPSTAGKRKEEEEEKLPRTSSSHTRNLDNLSTILVPAAPVPVFGCLPEVSVFSVLLGSSMDFLRISAQRLVRQRRQGLRSSLRSFWCGHYFWVQYPAVTCSVCAEYGNMSKFSVMTSRYVSVFAALLPRQWLYVMRQFA